MAEGYRCVHAILSILTTAGRGGMGLPVAQDADNSGVPNNLLVPRQALWNGNTMKWTKITENGFEVGEGDDDVPSSEPGSRFSEISRSDAAKAARYVRNLLALPDLSGMRVIPIDSFKQFVDFDSPDLRILDNWIMGIWSKTQLNRRSRNRHYFPASSLSIKDIIVNVIDKSGTGAGDNYLATCPDSFAACVHEMAQEFLGDDGFVQQNVVDPTLIPSFKFLHGMVWRAADMQKSKALRVREESQRGRGRGRGSIGRVGTRGAGHYTSTQSAPPAKRRGRPPKVRQDGHNLRPAPRVSSRYMDATPGWSNDQPIDLVDDEDDVKMEDVDQNEPQLAYPDASQLPGPSGSQMNAKKSQGGGAGEQQAVTVGTSERSDSSSRSQPASNLLPAVSASSNDVLAQLFDNVKDLNETEKWQIVGEAVQVQQQWQALQNKLREKRQAQEGRGEN